MLCNCRSLFINDHIGDQRPLRGLAHVSAVCLCLVKYQDMTSTKLCEQSENSNTVKTCNGSNTCIYTQHILVAWIFSELENSATPFVVFCVQPSSILSKRELLQSRHVCTSELRCPGIAWGSRLPSSIPSPWWSLQKQQLQYLLLIFKRPPAGYIISWYRWSHTDTLIIGSLLRCCFLSTRI